MFLPVSRQAGIVQSRLVAGRCSVWYALNFYQNVLLLLQAASRGRGQEALEGQRRIRRQITYFTGNHSHWKAAG